MPSFDIVKKINPDDTYRVSSVCGAFDLEIEHVIEHFKGNIAIENMDWNVGLIVGGSGTGKSTIAKEIFGNEYFNKYEYKEKSVIDDMPKGKSIKDIEKAFTSVGFASPPSWLKPYDVLSNGEKMRVELARNILDDKELIVFDEFTSVVNREVAKTASYAISKAVKNQNKKFVAVSCHSDIIEWLEPDWIYNTDEQAFFTLRGNSTAPQSNLRYTGLITKLKMQYGTYSESIII
jgi:ABC-type ATPase with predicted acetyltransferase domain